ncbi:MAG: hypothetical protein Q7T72_06250 [Bacteroidales bacterium]|nr:hypothetical protein [Bacteroidales bacterium]
MIIIFPRGVKDVAVSTTTRPVTHTALTDVNKESRKVRGRVCALGSINSPDPIRMIIKKLVEKSKAGGMFMELISLANTDISEMAIRKIATTIERFPKKNVQKDLLLVTILKLDKKTPNENRNTNISNTNDMTIFFLKCNISGRNFERNSIRNKILNVDLSFNMLSSVIVNPI